MEVIPILLKEKSRNLPKKKYYIASMQIIIGLYLNYTLLLPMKKKCVFEHLYFHFLFIFFSGLFLIERDFKTLLGGAEYDNEGKIISARAVELKLIGLQNGTAALHDEIKADSALGEYVISRLYTYVNTNKYDCKNIFLFSG